MLPQPTPPAAVPPPPPPPPGRRNAWLPWALGLTVLAAAAVVLVVVLTGGDDGTAASSTSTTAAATTTHDRRHFHDGGHDHHRGHHDHGRDDDDHRRHHDHPLRPPLQPAELDYFEEIAGQAEYGDGGGILHKWIDDVRIQVFGDPTRRDLAVLDNVIEDINSLIGPVAADPGGERSERRDPLRPRGRVRHHPPRVRPGEHGLSSTSGGTTWGRSPMPWC